MQDQLKNESNPLIPPERGSFPVAFPISHGAVIIDFCGPREVFRSADVPGHEGEVFQTYTVADDNDLRRWSWLKRIVGNDLHPPACCNRLQRLVTAFHEAYERFDAQYPDIHLKRGARFVEDGNLASAGGLSSGIDLAIRVIERYYGRKALRVGRA
jgi:hypothetical protein